MTKLMSTGLRSPEVARRLGLEGADVYRLLFDGALEGGPGRDGVVYFSEASVQAYLDTHGRGAGQTFGQTNDDKPTRTRDGRPSPKRPCEQDERGSTRTTPHRRGALITRRSRVQIPPPPLRSPGQE